MLREARRSRLVLHTSRSLLRRKRHYRKLTEVYDIGSPCYEIPSYLLAKFQSDTKSAEKIEAYSLLLKLLCESPNQAGGKPKTPADICLESFDRKDVPQNLRNHFHEIIYELKWLGT